MSRGAVAEGSVAAVIVGYNNLEFLEGCCTSLYEQTRAVDQVLYVDNGSHDGSVEYIRSHFPAVEVCTNNANLGFAAASNIGIAKSNTDYVIILNPDVVMDSRFVAIAMQGFLAAPRVGGVCGKTMHLCENGTSDIIDSAGLICTRSRRILDRGAGKLDEGQYDRAQEVFGASAHCVVFSMEALENVSKEGQGVFDEDFYMYKEDVDLWWRLQACGWTCWYTPEALTYHKRGTGVEDRSSITVAFRARTKLSRFQKYYSYRNHRLLLVKNARPPRIFPDLAWIVFGELRAFVWLLLFEPYNLGAVLSVFKFLPPMLRKRQLSAECGVFGNSNVEAWFDDRSEQG